MINLDSETRAQRAYMIALRREFHRYPELSLKEFRTAQRIEEELNRMGVSCRRVGDTGVLGTLRGAGTGANAVALRADIDALPIEETNCAAYHSETSGVMHACGHDAHTACLLGAARILAHNREAFSGEIRLIFQPAEEIGQGAQSFLDAGALEGVSRVFGLHTAPDLPAGKVGLKPGLNNAAVDRFCIQITVRSAHVSAPQQGVDALYIACQTVVSLQALVTRRTAPTDPVILGVGTLRAGTTYNALAASAALEGTTRTITCDLREQLREQITQVAQQTAALYGGSAAAEWQSIASPLINDAQVCREAAAAAASLQGADCVISDRALSLSGDNFAEYLLKTPGAYAYLGTGNPALPDTMHPLHSDRFDIDEDALPLGAGLYAGYALSRLQSA